MKKLIYILFLLPFIVKGQTTYKILADSTRLGHISNSGNELVLENDTRDTLGVIANVGNGRTQFKALRLQQLTDSTFRLLLGNTAQGQTIAIKSSGGGGGATYTLTKNATRDSIILTGSNGTRYAVFDTLGIPYTGATNNLNLGNNDLEARSIKITGTSGGGYLQLKNQTGPLPSPAGNLIFYADPNGNISYVNNNNTAIFQVDGNTNNRTYRMPDSSGTVALLSNIKTVVSYSKNATRDSIILLMSDGSRYAVLDSIGISSNIYNSNGVISETRLAEVNGSINFADLDTINRTYSLIGIGDSVLLPDGSGGYVAAETYGPNLGMYLFSSTNTISASNAPFAAYGSLFNYNTITDITQNKTIGLISAQDTASNTMSSEMVYNDQNSGQYLALKLNETNGFNVFPFEPMSNLLPYKQPYSFSVFDTLQNKVFGITTDGTTEATNVSATKLQITGTNGNGSINLTHQASDATANNSSTALFADNLGDLKYKNDNLYYTTLKTSGNTANRTYRFPDSSGTVALTSNVVSVSSYGKNAGKDSTVLLLSNGTRFAAKDSIGGASGLTNGSTNISGSTTNWFPRDSSGFLKFSPVVRLTTSPSVVLEVEGNVRSTLASFAPNGFKFNSGSNAGLTNYSGYDYWINLHSFGTRNTICQFTYDGSQRNISLMRASATDATIGFGDMDAAGENAQGTYRIFNTSASAIRSATGTMIFYANSSLSGGGTTTLTERMRIQNDGTVAINNSSPSTKAILDVASTTQGFLPPRMTTTQRDAITTPPAGLTIYNTTDNKLQVYDGSAWQSAW